MKGVSTVVVVAVVAVVVVAAIAAGLMLAGGGPGSPIPKPTTGVIIDDFDDMSLGSNFPGTSAGMMGGYPPDAGPEYFGFEEVAPETYALKLVVDLPANVWSGYWSFVVPGDISQDPILVSLGSGRDFSSYSELRMAVRATKTMQFKVELQDTVQHSDSTKAKTVFMGSSENQTRAKYGMSPAELADELFDVAPENIDKLTNADVHIRTQSHNGSVTRTAHTTWEEIVIPFNELNPASSVGPRGLNLSDIRQLNIVFDKPGNATFYVDWIAIA